VSRLCKAADVSRSGYYRFLKPDVDRTEEMELQDEIQKIAIKNPAYGYRRITAELARRKRVVNRKRVLRMMREDNLLCLRRRSFIRTTNSDHKLPVYPNLAKELKVCGLNQLWVADITYIRLLHEFVYLAVILDSFSRRVIGWSLGKTLESDLAVDALRMAINRGRVQPGLVHHSDRGSQYASGAYTDLLADQGIGISMSRRGNPYDNAKAESFMKTLKYEEVYRSEYRDISEARRCIRRFIESVYNRNRLHSALGYLPPVEFEQSQMKSLVVQA
jgi:putative transposase